MPRDYDPMLASAEDLESFGSGYLNDLDRQQINKIQMQFDQARRTFVYELLNVGGDTTELWPSVSVDLDAIKARGNNSYGAIDTVRTALEIHIAKQAGSSPLKRFFVRWTLPVVSGLAGIAYIYVKFFLRK